MVIPGTTVLGLLLLYVGHQLQGAAAQTTKGSIICYNNLPTAPGARPAATPIALQKKDGYEMCTRYMVRCADRTACPDAAPGTYRWYYIATSRENCRQLVASAASLGVKNVKCCTTNGCNKPDARLDKDTQVLNDSWLSRSITPSTPTPRTPALLPAAEQNTVTAAGQVLAAGPVTTEAAAPNTITCMQGLPSAPGQPQQVAPMNFPAKEFQVCARYMSKCSASDTACTAAEAKAGSWRWNYIATSKATCDALAAMVPAAGVKNVLCCSKPKCNTPDPKLDTSVKVVQLPAAATGASKTTAAVTTPDRPVVAAPMPVVPTAKLGNSQVSGAGR